MATAKAQKKKGRIDNSPTELFLAFSIVSIPLFFWPDSMDVFAIPKALLVCSVALFLIPSVLANFRTLLISERLIVILVVPLISLFQLQVFVAKVKWVALMGVQGRGTGALLYIAVLIVFLGVVLSNLISDARRLTNALNALFLLNGVYGVVQLFGLDPFDWQVVYDGVVGFYGNPNFMSSMSGFGVIVSVGLLLVGNLKGILKLSLFVSLITNIVSLVASESTQGWVVAFVGVILVFFRQFKEKRPFISKSLLLSSGLFGILGLLAIFNLGPLRKLLYQESIGFRFDFWKIATRMIMDNPLGGVGIDRYQNFYRIYKDTDQVNRLGAEEFSDAAHNFYLQIAATGGLPLTLIFLVVNLYVLFRAFKKIRSIGKLSLYGVIFALWIGIQMQSLISVDQPGIVFLGWVLAGLLISGSRIEPLPTNYISGAILQRTLGILLLVPGLIFAGTILDLQSKLRVAFYAYVAPGDVEAAQVKNEFFSSLERRSPGDPILPIYAANSLFIDKSYEFSAAAAERAIAIDPDDYRAWWFLASSLESIDRSRAIEARGETIRLSPFNTQDLFNQFQNYLEIESTTDAEAILAKIKSISPMSEEFRQAQSLLEKAIVGAVP